MIAKKPEEQAQSLTPVKAALFITAATLVAVTLIIPIILDSRIAPAHLKAQYAIDGSILQSTGVTCAPAAAANIARYYHISIDEPAMVSLMGTTGEGTSIDEIIVGMHKLGISGEMVVRQDIGEVSVPALLIVDHEATGPQSHVVALVNVDRDTVEIVDPLIGKRRFPVPTLLKMWHGRAIIFEDIRHIP